MLANKIGSDQRDAERKRVIQAEDQRQQNFQNKSTNLFNQTLDKVKQTTAADAAKTEAANQTASDSALIDSGGNYKPATGSAPQEVGDSVARATSDAIARGKEQARLNAKTGGVRRTNFNNAITLGRAGDEQATIGGNMQRSARCCRPSSKTRTALAPEPARSARCFSSRRRESVWRG